jgi:hypothetical protein
VAARGQSGGDGLILLHRLLGLGGCGGLCCWLGVRPAAMESDDEGAVRELEAADVAELLGHVFRGDLQSVQRQLSEEGIRRQMINARDEEGWTPLLLAAAEGHTDVVRLLLMTAGCDMEARCAATAVALNGWPPHWHPRHARPAHGIHHQQQFSLACRLLAAAWSLGRLDGEYTALLLASMAGHTDVVRQLVDVGGVGSADSVRSGDGSTALMMAAANGEEGVVTVLLDHGGADVEARNTEGQSALSLAAKGVHPTPHPATPGAAAAAQHALAPAPACPGLRPLCLVRRPLRPLVRPF